MAIDPVVGPSLAAASSVSEGIGAEGVREPLGGSLEQGEPALSPESPRPDSGEQDAGSADPESAASLAPEDQVAIDALSGAAAEHRRAQLEAERSKSMAFEAKVLYEGNEQVSPLIGLPSKALYAVREHHVPSEKSGFRTAFQHIRVDKDRRPKKLRKRERRAERARAAASASAQPSEATA